MLWQRDIALSTCALICSSYEERYLPASQLAELERYTHLYYDLSINIAGIDAIHHMLERID